MGNAVDKTSASIEITTGARNYSSSSLEPGSFLSVHSADSTEVESSLPADPEPAALAGDHYTIEPSAKWHQIPFSRVGIGANVNPMGVGILGAIVLNHYLDARVLGNFFGYTGNFEVEGFHVNADIHMASVGAALDYYPFGSVFRVSPGVLFYNGNQVSGNVQIASGTSFSLGSQTYYSATANAVTGATPLTGVGVLGLHATKPAFTVAGGFGKFIPRSNRHWSFPTEFGVAFTGSPTIDFSLSGWACLDARQTRCSDVGDPTNPIAIQFNDNLQSRLDRFRTQLDKVTVYPMISTSVVYSFNTR